MNVEILRYLDPTCPAKEAQVVLATSILVPPVLGRKFRGWNTALRCLWLSARASIKVRCLITAWQLEGVQNHGSFLCIRTRSMMLRRWVWSAIGVRELLIIKRALWFQLLNEPKDAVHVTFLSVKVLKLLVEVVLPIDLLISHHLLIV